MIKYPFVIISDVHCHDWDAFSYVREDKVNSRLHEILLAIEEAALAVREAGGNDMIITGDLFHTRGRIKPSVFNPVFMLFQRLCREGLRVWALPGNHDLEGKHSDTIGNALYAFEEIEGFTVFNELSEVGNFTFIPWIEYKEDFVNVINGIGNPTSRVIFCHIGIDGVLDNVAGKVGKAVLDRGFKYVFSGDYHNHKSLGNGIYSVGALTHHSFGDVGSQAGFLLVTEDEVKQVETSAPKFVEAYSAEDPKGNYVRLKGEMTESDQQGALAFHYEYGALAIQDLTTRPTLKETSQSTAPVRVDLSIDKALESYAEFRYGENSKAVINKIREIRNGNV